MKTKFLRFSIVQKKEELYMDALDKNVQQRMDAFFNELVDEYDKKMEDSKNLTKWKEYQIKSDIFNKFSNKIGKVITGEEDFDIFKVDRETYLSPEMTEEDREKAIEHLYRLQNMAIEIQKNQRARLGIFIKPVEFYEVVIRPFVNILGMFAWLSSGIAPLKMAVELALTIYYQKKHRNVH